MQYKQRGREESESARENLNYFAKINKLEKKIYNFFYFALSTTGYLKIITFYKN